MSTATGEQLDDQPAGSPAPTTPQPVTTTAPERVKPLNGNTEPMDDPRTAR
jgi:hypothetical protein